MPGPGPSLPSGKGPLLPLSLSRPLPFLASHGLSAPRSLQQRNGATPPPPGGQGTVPTPAAAGWQRAPPSESRMQVALITPTRLLPVGVGTRGGSP